MDVLGMIYRIQWLRLRVLEHRAEWQFNDRQKELYKQALDAERVFWFRYRDWYELYERDEYFRDLIAAAADAYEAWSLLWLTINKPASIETRIMMFNEEKADA